MSVNQLISPVVEKLTHFFECGPHENSRRIFHGRGKTVDGLDWLVVDWYSGFVFAIFFKAPEDDIELALKDALTSVLVSANIKTLLIQRRYLPKAPIEAWLGEVPDSAFAQRNGLKYGLSFGQQNLGFFLDIEPARQWLESNASGAKILNLFSYTCTFSVVARAAGATSVVNIDLSKKSLSVGRENHRINNLSLENIEFYGHDIFRSWGKLKRKAPYDIVVIDPPSFQKGSFIATKDYGKVIAKMDDLLTEDGYFLACLNAPEISTEEFQTMVEARAEGFSLVQVLAPHEDFPDVDKNHSLKMLVYQRSQ